MVPQLLGSLFGPTANFNTIPGIIGHVCILVVDDGDDLGTSGLKSHMKKALWKN